MKTCRKCGKTKPLNQMLKDFRTRDGRTGRCYACQREYYAAHKQLNGRWRQTHKRCPGCGIIKPRADFGEKKGSIRDRCRPCAAAKARAYRWANRVLIRQQKLRWERAHPGRRREWEARRRARKRGGVVSKVDYSELVRKNGYICALCGGFVLPSELHFDHIIPLAAGGAHTKRNLQVTHALCNMRKHTKVGRRLYGNTEGVDDFWGNRVRTTINKAAHWMAAEGGT